MSLPHHCAPGRTWDPHKESSLLWVYGLAYAAGLYGCKYPIKQELVTPLTVRPLPPKQYYCIKNSSCRDVCGEGHDHSTIPRTLITVKDKFLLNTIECFMLWLLIDKYSWNLPHGSLKVLKSTSIPCGNYDLELEKRWTMKHLRVGVHVYRPLAVRMCNHKVHVTWHSFSTTIRSSTKHRNLKNILIKILEWIIAN